MESLFAGFFVCLFLLLTVPPGASGELVTHIYLLEYGLREEGQGGVEGAHKLKLHQSVLAEGTQL